MPTPLFTPEAIDRIMARLVVGEELMSRSRIGVGLRRQGDGYENVLYDDFEEQAWPHSEASLRAYLAGLTDEGVLAQYWRAFA